MDGAAVETQYGRPVSYGIRRYEFDDYLLRRCGARLLEGIALTGLERSGGEWIINGQIRTPMLVGAGGTFCPVARFLGAKVNREVVVTAQEAEFEMDERQLSGCAVRGETPELYFCSDLKGYGWCVRKQNVLNVGLGRVDRHSVARHAAQFLEFLKAVGRLKFVVPSALLGHAYLLYGRTTREVAGEGVVLIGDAAGVAYAQSGEGIRPAIESGLLAAKAIASAHRCYSQERLELYGDLVAERFGKPDRDWLTRIGRRLPAGVISAIARRLLASPWFAREVVLNGWFLRQNEPALRFS
jgi:flavin-dependent dehydrogenase